MTHTLTKPTCDRCKRTWNGREDNWNTTVRGGHVVGYLCPRCQTPEEWTEAEVNVATISYGRDSFGRITGGARV